jgi:hypothetical protein
MSQIIKKITSSPTTTTLISKGGATSGNVKKIIISNFSDNADGATVHLFLNDGGANDLYFFKNVVIPKGATLIFEDLAFDSSLYNLKIYNAGTSPAITIILNK